MRVFEAISAAIATRGVDTVFGVLGEGNLLVVEDLVRVHGIEYVAAAREDGATSMADGWSRASGRVGLATVTHGPGLTNVVTALTEAVRSRTPMVLLIGDTAVDDPWNLQDIDQAAVVAPTGAAWHVVRAPDTAAADVRAAFDRAAAEHRPVVLDVPVDLLEKTVPNPAAEPVAREVAAPAAGPDPRELDTALGILASARRPVLLAGRGAVRSGAREDLIALAGRIGAPLATTLAAKGFFSGVPGNLGVVGTLSSSRAGEAVAAADCLVVFGAGLNFHTAARGALLEGKAVVQVDSEPGRIGRWFPVDASVVGDAAAVARAMSDALEDAGHRPTDARRAEVAGLEGADAPDPFDDASADNTVDMRTFLRRLDGLLPAERTVVTDGGHFMGAPWLHLGVAEAGGLLTTVSFAAVGLGLATAIGAAVARSDRLVVAVLGDGGLMMSLSELTTAVRLRLPLLVVVLNDSGYGAEYHAMIQRGMDPALSQIRWPDLGPVATALGAVGLTATRADDAVAVAEALRSSTGPVLVDVKLDPAVRIGFHD
jgi:acetolactate synthase-1/2/3 large subunit